MSSPSTIVLITGANVGIGYAATKVIASASSDYHVIMTGRSSEKIQTALSKIQQESGVKGTVSSLVLDVTDEDSIARAADQVKQSFGRLDVLVNNAGIVSTSDNLKQNMQETLLANSIGPVLVTEAFVALLKQSPNPRILYVSSGLGSFDQSPSFKGQYMIYSMSKAALDMAVVKHSQDPAKKGIKVWAVCPGLVRSNLRGTSEDAVNAGGNAGDPEVSGQTMLGIIEGRRDGEVGLFVHKDGVYGW